MPFNGSGLFNLIYNWQNDAAQGLNISSSRMQNQDADIASGLSNCLTKDGQQTPVANLPMGGFRLTNLGNATQQGNAVTVQDIQNGNVVSLNTVAGTDTITANTTPAIGSYAAGQRFLGLAAGKNATNAVTLNVNGLGAKNVTKFGGNALTPGDIQGTLDVRYDGTQFQLLNPLSALGTVATKAASYVGVASADYDNVIIFTSAGDYTLPSAASAGNGWKVTIGNGSTFAAPVQVRILRSSTDTIDEDAATAVYVLPGELVEIRSNGTSKFWTRGRTPKGRIINVSQFYADSGSSTTSTSFVGAQGAVFSYQPISPASLLRLDWFFSGNIQNVSAVNNVGNFQIFETTSGNVGIGVGYRLDAFSSPGGIGAEAPISITVAGLSNTVLTVRSFDLFHATNNASGGVSSNSIRALITEFQNA